SLFKNWRQRPVASWWAIHCCKSQARHHWQKRLLEKSASSQIENTLACCAKRGRRQFLFQPISVSRSLPLRFASQIQLRLSSKSCSNSRPSRLHLRLVFTQAQLLIEALSSESVYRSNRMRSSRPAQESAMTQSSAREVTSATRRRSDHRVSFLRD